MSARADPRTSLAHAGPGEAWAGHRAAHRARVLDAAGLVARLVLGSVLLAAGLPKATDLTGSVQNLLAYELFDYEVARLIGTTLPVIEIALGVLLIVGLLTRGAAATGAALMVVFIGGIISAWARGLAIDCGCFGTGGPVDPGQTTYLLDTGRDLALLALAIWLVVRPRTPFALDNLMRGR